jgi:predicted aldo/keto reductase-like oxidoreductase
MAAGRVYHTAVDARHPGTLPSHTMIFRPYGRTGVSVSLLGFGGMRFGAIDDREASVALMVEAARAGVTYFDTAPGYFGGKSEETFGEAFREMRRLGLPYLSATKTFSSTEAEIRAQVETQLARLGIPAINFYHAWCITTRKDWEDRKANGIVPALRKLKEEGLVRHLCVSSHLIGDEIRELLMEGIFEGVLFGYSACNFRARERAFDAIAAKGLGCAVMNPLGGGLIPQNPDLFSFLKSQEDESVTQAALRFLFSDPRISTVLVGFSDVHQLREAVAAVEQFAPMKAAEIAGIKAASGERFLELCTGCGYCDSCPEGIPVPRLMEAYNHKRLRGRDTAVTERLAWHWSVGPEEAAKCTACGQCEEACTQHLPIIERLEEIAAMKPHGKS